MKKVYVSLKELYKQKGANLHYGRYIDFYSDEETEYYDLVTACPDIVGSSVICCDGEECEMIFDDGKSILLSNVESRNKFYLTKEEYDIAVFE